MTIAETLLEFYERTKLPAENFDSFVARTGTERLKEILEPLRQVPSFEKDPSFYEDFGHEHERFAVRKGIKGECAGSTVAETIPTIDAAREWLAQAEALIYHNEHEHAVLAAYEAAAAAARVPLYRKLVDPFTADEALWEFENLFVLSGQTRGAWQEVSSRFEALRQDALEDVRQTSVCRDSAGRESDETRRQTSVCRTPNEVSARMILDEARSFVSYCAQEKFSEAGAAG